MGVLHEKRCKTPIPETILSQNQIAHNLEKLEKRLQEKDVICKNLESRLDGVRYVLRQLVRYQGTPNKN